VQPVEVRVTIARDARERVRFKVALFSDLTLEREVARKERQIRKLEETQRLALGLAHEIRNPLASIRGCCQEIRRMTVDGQQARLARIVMDESDRLDSIIEEFQCYARVTPSRLVTTDLVGVLDTVSVLLSNRSEFGARELLWSRPSESRWIEGDRDRLIQIALNLGLNAIEATDAEVGHIGLSIEESDEHWELCVSDNGPGISAAEIASVLAPFYTTKQSGTGLGLAIVERIVDEHGGEICIELSEEGGALVRLRFPKSRSVLEGESIEHSTRQDALLSAR
jgi:signal transduction histidine kinase